MKMVIVDGSKALRTAPQATFDKAPLAQRSHIHKFRNVMDHLPERQRPCVQANMRAPTAVTCRRRGGCCRILPSPRGRVSQRGRECARALDETVTVQALGLSERLQRSLTTTNATEGLIGRTRHVKRNVKGGAAGR